MTLCTVPSGAAEWHENYEAGTRASEAGDFADCVKHMSMATLAKPREEKSARSYGMDFIDYPPCCIGSRGCADRRSDGGPPLMARRKSRIGEMSCGGSEPRADGSQSQ